jgi:predicted RNase H-like nuclease (RuvC/YqgF family)
MIDGNIFITVIPPVFAAIIAYAIARIKSNAAERIQRAKIESDADGRAMNMVKSIVEDMRSELKAEIASLRVENTENKLEIENLRKRLRESAELQDAMKLEIASLKNTIQWYERRLQYDTQLGNTNGINIPAHATNSSGTDLNLTNTDTNK